MRHFKQFVYGLFYLAVFGGIILWIYSAWFGLPSIRPAATAPAVAELEVSGQPMIFHPTASSVSVMVQVQNPNQTVSGKKFSYKFVLRDDKGNQVPNGEIDGESFIYAGEIKYIAEFNKSFPNSSNISSADFSVVGEPEWIDQSFFQRPNLQVQNKSTSVSGNGVEVSGSAINNGTTAVGSVDVLAIIYSKLGQPAGISKTEINNIAPGGQQDFSIAHPPLSNVDTSATDVELYGY